MTDPLFDLMAPGAAAARPPGAAASGPGGTYPTTPASSTPPVAGDAGPDDGAVATGEGAAAPALVIDVFGTPAPQGSKRHVGNGVMVESSKKVKPWREAVKWAALERTWVQFPGPVAVNILFRFPRPKSHFRTGKNAHELRPNAPAYPAGRPDIDKCLRSTLDALGEAGVFRDDAQVVILGGMKGYADQQPPGAYITVRALT